MGRVIVVLMVFTWGSTAFAQLAYQSGSAISYSTAYVGETLTPTPGLHDTDSDVGTTGSSAAAEYDNDTAWAGSSLFTGGIFDYVESRAGSDNTSNAGGSLGDENAAHSHGEQQGEWDTSLTDSVTYTFIASVLVSDDTINGSSAYWSENLFLSGQATAGPFVFIWQLNDEAIEWWLLEDGYTIDSGSKALSDNGTDWTASVTQSITDYLPDTLSTVSTRTNTGTMFGGYFMCRSGEGQTGVILTE